MSAGGRRSRQWRGPECLGTGYPPPASQRLPSAPAPYPCVVQRNGNIYTYQVRRSETYPSIQPPGSRCQESKSPAGLIHNRGADGRGRPFDMERDDVLQVWQQSPHKDTLGFYGVGSPAHQPESLRFNQLLAQCLNKASGTPRQRPPKSPHPPQLRRVQSSKPFPSQPCPPLILNRWVLQQEMQRMPQVQQQLSPRRALRNMYCWAYPEPNNPFGLPAVLSEEQPLRNLSRTRSVAPKPKRRTKFWYCPPCWVPSPKTNSRNLEAFNQPDPSEPRNYDELYKRLVGCFEPTEDPLCKVYEACCKPKKPRGKDGGAGGTGDGAGGTGDGDRDGQDSNFSGPGSGSVLRPSLSNYGGNRGAGDGGEEKASRGDKSKEERPNKGDKSKEERANIGDKNKEDSKKREEEGDKDKDERITKEKEKANDKTKEAATDKVNKVKDRDSESLKSKYEYVRKDKKNKTKEKRKSDTEEPKMGEPLISYEDVEDYRPIREPSKASLRTPSRLQILEPPPYVTPEDMDLPTKKPIRKRRHSKKRSHNAHFQDKNKKPPCPPCPPCPPPECQCEICHFMERRRREPEAPFIRDMRRAEKRLQLRNYYRQMCHRSYMACRTDEEYRAPLRKCDPIKCEDFFCNKSRLYEHCECLTAVQELQKLLKGSSNKRILNYVDNLCQRICQRMCDCILT